LTSLCHFQWHQRWLHTHRQLSHVQNWLLYWQHCGVSKAFFVPQFSYSFKLCSWKKRKWPESCAFIVAIGYACGICFCILRGCGNTNNTWHDYHYQVLICHVQIIKMYLFLVDELLKGCILLFSVFLGFKFEWMKISDQSEAFLRSCMIILISAIFLHFNKSNYNKLKIFLKFSATNYPATLKIIRPYSSLNENNNIVQ